MSYRALIRNLINRAWIATYVREQARFTVALKNVAETQQHALFRLLRHNARTDYGIEHGFAQIQSVAEFQKRVPITPYEEFKDAIEAIAAGKYNVLTSDPVERFHPTSGSSSPTKFIPWTAPLAQEFRRGIAPWIASLYRRKPRLMKGSAYWSISPPVTAINKYGQIPVGFENDSEYLGFLGKKLFSVISAVSSDVVNCSSPDEFRNRTLVSLLADTDLSLISIWSPTFLTILLDDFLERRDEILELMKTSGVGKNRIDHIRNLTAGTARSCFEALWPNLQLISCWTHGPSALYAKNLRHYFPKTEIQAKGLVATEAFVSLPYQQDKDPVLSVTSHFFEFQDAESERIFLAHELEAGRTYRVIVTTGGGLYRYPLGDLVFVTGFLHQAPCLRFVGRESNVSDLFGEKLNGMFVENVIQKALADQDIKARFFLLAPTVQLRGQTHYTLFLEADIIPNTTTLQQTLEAGLRANFHYAHCQDLNQLLPARIFQITAKQESAQAIYHQEMLSRGIKIGNIKTSPLDNRSGWELRFEGHFCQAAWECVQYE